MQSYKREQSNQGSTEDSFERAEDARREILEVSGDAPQNSALKESQISFLALFTGTTVMGLGYTAVEGLGKELQGPIYQLDAFDFAFVRNLVIGLIALGLTSYKDVGFFREDAVFKKNWKMLVANGVCGAISMVLSNLAWFLLPLTIWFVITCTLPFVLAIISYFASGEAMTRASILAAALSFAAIVVLTIAKPKNEDDGVETSHNYTLGIIVVLANVMCIAGVVLTTRWMQKVHAFQIMQSYNLMSAAFLGIYILLRWPVSGVPPLDMEWCSASAWMLFGTCAGHFIAQITMFYVNQKAQPALVSLMSYFGISFRVVVDIAIFRLVPNLAQTVSIVALVIIQVAHLVYKQMTWRAEKRPQKASKAHHDCALERDDDVYAKQ